MNFDVHIQWRLYNSSTYLHTSEQSEKGITAKCVHNGYWVSLVLFIVQQACDTVTRTSEWVITLWKSCELFLCRDISRVCRTSPISLPKTMNMISTEWSLTHLFLFLCRTTIDWMLILMVYVYNFKEFTGETAIS